MILADAEELTEVLVKTYKIDIEVYNMVIKILVREGLSEICKETSMEQV